MPIADKAARVAARYNELNRLMADPEIATNPERITAYAQEQAELRELHESFHRYQKVNKELIGTKQMLQEDDLESELVELAKMEINQLQAERAELENRMKRLLLPKDPNDDKNVIVEIRAGAGGDEAGIFAGNLYRMYTRYADSRRWQYDLISSNPSGVGGFKEVIFSVRGYGAYSRLKYESGVHRVQRVPDTESQGRIHTSTATVLVMAEQEEIDIEFGPNDLRIDIYRSSGPGGQSVNTTDSAVRITHLPTGISISCQDEKSQLQNKLKAMRLLRARIFDVERQKRDAELGATRKSLIGSGDRSEKIRTYNYPQSRVTDHRIKLTSYKLDSFMGGDIDPFIEALATTEQTNKLAELAG